MKQLDLAATVCFKGHCLILQRVHPRQATNGRLIQFHRLPGLFARLGIDKDFLMLGKQLPLKRSSY